MVVSKVMKYKILFAIKRIDNIVTEFAFADYYCIASSVQFYNELNENSSEKT